MDSSAFYLKYKQCHALADLAKSNKKRAVWERPCGKNRVLLHNHGRYRVLYTIHYIGIYFFIMRGEQYFREEFINVTENVAVNRYCSLCATTYIVAWWIIRILRNRVCSFFSASSIRLWFVFLFLFLFFFYEMCNEKK